jgi:hypothetical protein
MSDSITRLIFLMHLSASLYMVGLIWFVQVVHYPMFAKVGTREFAIYEQRHSILTTWVVGPPMLIELATALLLFWFPVMGIPRLSLWIGLGLVGVIWVSTAIIQVPCHEALKQGFDQTMHQRLVGSNWLRTVAWSARGVLVLWMAWVAF